MRRGEFLLGVIAFATMAVASPHSVLASVVLITADEAKLPPPKGATSMDRRGVTRGPRVELVSASDSTPSPIHLRMKFQSFGGATIDPASVKVTYVKEPAVDLTPRLKTFVQPTGIDVPDAAMPAGNHTVKVDLKDSEGRSGSATFVLKIAP